MCAQILLCFLAIVTYATGFSLNGFYNFNPNPFSVQGSNFPVPGISVINETAQIFSTALKSSVPDAENLNDWSEFGNDDSAPAKLLFLPKQSPFFPVSSLTNFIPVPNITALLESRNLTNATNVIVSFVSPISTKHKFHPDFNFALWHARKHLVQALNQTGDVSTAVQNALQQAFLSSDPSAAINNVIQTIIRVYGMAIQNCPFIFMSAAVASEASRLVTQVIRAVSTAMAG